ncbi:MAG: hypothetical protein LBJ48_02905 [Coriobacteriales bacterium]|nr:hypothetical protein [Coriobacteriales bacterium]
MTQTSHIAKPRGLLLNPRLLVSLALSLVLALQLAGAAVSSSQARALDQDEIGLEVEDSTTASVTQDELIGTFNTTVSPADVPEGASVLPLAQHSLIPQALLTTLELTNLPTAPTPYAWSRTLAETTGDFFADTYRGVGSGSVFEDVTVDRLADILSAEGDYYLVFANPNTASAQTILADINAQAKLLGVSKIYHFNPVVDNFRLDITSTDPAIRDITSGTWSTDITGGAADTSFASIPHSIGGIYTYIKSLLPVYYAVNSTPEDLATKAIFDSYTSEQTLLFRFHKDSHTDLPAAASIDATYLFGEADGTVTYDQATELAQISPVFKDGSSVAVAANTRSEYQFITRGFAATGANPAISAADYPDGAGFNLDSVTFEETFNLLNSPGEHSFYFFAFGCSDTKALIAKAALAAKENGTTVYLVDGSLGGSIRYKSGADIDVLSTSTSNAWLNIRLGNNASETSAQKNLSYLYGELVNGYFGDGFITENSFKKASSNIQYYLNGDIGNPDALTNGFKQDGATRPYAPRLQYPILLTYNKAYVEPVTLATTAIKVTRNSEGVVTAVTEYMGSVAKQDSSYNTSLFTPYVNATDPVFLAAQRADQELIPAASFTTAGVPYITSSDLAGLPVIGVPLHANTGSWVPEPTSFSYQWYSFDEPIAGATQATYTPVIEDYCNEISVKVTAHRSGYSDTTRQSDFVQPEPAEADDITVVFTGPEEVVVGAVAEYTVGVGTIAGPAAFELTVRASSQLELKSVAALNAGWIAVLVPTDDDTSKIVFGRYPSNPNEIIYAAEPQLKLVYEAKTVGSASVTLVSLLAASTAGFVDDVAQPQWETIVAPTGDDAVVLTEIGEAPISYAQFDFNRDDELDLLDLAFATGYYGASAQAGGGLWNVASERGIDVDASGEIDVADFIIIINTLYAL